MFSQSLDKPRFMTSFQTERNLWTFLIIHALRGKPSRVAGQEASGPWLSGVFSWGNKQLDSQQYHLAESGCQAPEKQQRALVWHTWKGTSRGKNRTAPRLHIPALLLVFEHLQPRALGQPGAGQATPAGGRAQQVAERLLIRPRGRPSHAWKGEEGGQKEQWQRKGRSAKARAARSGQARRLEAVALQQAALPAPWRNSTEKMAVPQNPEREEKQTCCAGL